LRKDAFPEVFGMEIQVPRPLLITDCSTLGVQAGILGSNGWLAFARPEGEVASALFAAVKSVLQEADLTLSSLAGFGYCEGPGSTLGIRINAMAIRTWNSLQNDSKPCFAYKSLEAAMLMVEARETNQNPYALFSDLRKDCWNGIRIDNDSTIPPIEVVEKRSLNNWPATRWFLRQRLYSPGPPPEAEALEYDLVGLGDSEAFISRFRAVQKAGVFQTAITEYKKWVPQRHR